ncbi:hypothetical protein ETD83_05165 [Actinomadura soli]|uniref:Uncharacterized protein n=1 Tax=Actinomadura soli TaxID=2508997 RepID=A0A5C4JIX4_9ACTN|nr:hypothetical protein [Actinomadura soli]TMR06260.1 hypothetical protein ETD83_05165 [Actinomadura soli]
MRREHVIKLAAAANDTGDLTGDILRPDGEMSARIGHARSGHATDVTVILHGGFPYFARTTDHRPIIAIEDVAGTLAVIRHELVMRGQICRP